MFLGIYLFFAVLPFLDDVGPETVQNPEVVDADELCSIYKIKFK